MKQAILNFAKQFRFIPKIENGKIKRYKKYLVCGMGGSHLAADILKSLIRDLNITVHSEYGLPEISDKELSKTLVIASSYSGNTEETIDAFNHAKTRGANIAVVAVGGKLLDLAKQNNVPYVQLPDTGIQPRSAIGFSLLAHLKISKQSDLLKEAKTLSKILKPEEKEIEGKALAEKLSGKIPIIYSSLNNYCVAYNWKIKFNETGKIPAFYNLLPELNHNEMNGFDFKDSNKKLSENFSFVFLRDNDDYERVKKRMEVTEKILTDRGLRVETFTLLGATRLEKIFNSLLLADWASYYTATFYGSDPENVPIVEEFKKLTA